MGLINRWARLGSVAPRTATALARSAAGKWLAGVDLGAAPPAFARQTFRAWFERRRRPSSGGVRVLLWPDTFNNHFQPQTLIAATELLESAGFRVDIPKRPLCCGRPLYDWGFLDRAKGYLRRILTVLGEEIEAGTPIIGLEPACTSTFKDELLNLFPNDERARTLSGQFVYFADFVAARLDRFPVPRRGGAALVQAHCHHHAIIGFDQEQALFEHLGLEVERPPQGCCGMAGAFGMARETAPIARAIGERVLLPRVRALPAETIIIADGFSCREQISIHTNRPPAHISELLHARMTRENA